MFEGVVEPQELALLPRACFTGHAQVAVCRDNHTQVEVQNRRSVADVRPNTSAGAENGESGIDESRNRAKECALVRGQLRQLASTASPNMTSADARHSDWYNSVSGQGSKSAGASATNSS